MLYLHGTTRKRAEAILKNGPDVNFREPGQITNDPRSFSPAPVGGPFSQGDPYDIAVRKAALFVNEGGPAVLELDLPAEVVAAGHDEIVELRFDEDDGIDELLAAWPTISKRML